MGTSSSIITIFILHTISFSKKQQDIELKQNQSLKVYTTLTLLYSSNQISSSLAASHFSTLSSMSFLLKASSLTFEIWSSICSRRYKGSIVPKKMFGTWEKWRLIINYLIGLEKPRANTCYCNQTTIAQLYWRYT